MMEEIRSLEDLLDLQREDSDIDRLTERRQTLPELEAYRVAHQNVAAVESEIAEISDRLRDLDLGLDKAEGELQLGEQKLDQEERRLFAGGLSAKEAEHLRQEVEMLRRRSSEAETQILELMEQREQAQQQLVERQRRRDEAESTKSGLENRIQEEWKAIDAEIALHEAKKAEIVPLISPELLELYEQLRPTKEGVAVGRLAEGICGGCHLALSAAEQTEALAEDPPRCLHCRRILVPQ